MVNGPEGVHPGQRVLPRRDRGAAASSSPPGSARTASPARAGSARSWPSGSSTATPGMDVWHMDVRRFGPQYRSPGYTLARVAGELRDLLRHPATRARSGRPGRPLRTSPAYAWHAAHGAVFGEKAGWERVNHYAQRRRRRRATAARAAGPGASGRPASAPSTGRRATAAGAVRRVVVRQDRGDRAGRRRVCCDVGLRQPGRPGPPGAVTYTQVLNDRGGIEADVTVTRVAADDVPGGHRHRLRRARPGWLRAPGPAGGRGVGSPTSPASGRVSRCGGRGRRERAGAAHARGPVATRRSRS